MIKPSGTPPSPHVDVIASAIWAQDPLFRFFLFNSTHRVSSALEVNILLRLRVVSNPGMQTSAFVDGYKSVDQEIESGDGLKMDLYEMTFDPVQV